MFLALVFFFKQKTAYEMRMSDWSSDVCSSDLFATYAKHAGHFQKEGAGYQAILVTRSDTKLDSIEVLKGTVLGLTDPASTSGNLLPRVAFTDVIGSELENYFSKEIGSAS